MELNWGYIRFLNKTYDKIKTNAGVYFIVHQQVLSYLRFGVKEFSPKTAIFWPVWPLHAGFSAPSRAKFLLFMI